MMNAKWTSVGRPLGKMARAAMGWRGYRLSVFVFVFFLAS